MKDVLAHPIGLVCEGQLRAGAATLCRAGTEEITATTVVAARDFEDPHRLQALVDEIAEELGLHAHVRFGVTTFSVQFTRWRDRHLTEGDWQLRRAYASRKLVVLTCASRVRRRTTGT